MATEVDEALYDSLEAGDPDAVRRALATGADPDGEHYNESLRAGATLPPYVPDDEGDEEDPYLRKVRRAGGFPQYEAQVTKSLAAIFEPKFPKLPAEVIPTIVAFWAHVGDY